MNEDNPRRKKRIQASIAVVVLAAVLGGSALAFSGKNGASSASVSSSSSQSISTAKVNFKSGTYSATGSYDSPGGEEHLKITLTVADSVVTAASAVSDANDPTAQTYQDSFISGYKSQVVGKKLNAIQISNIAGSSLTTQGFNDALKQIENQAKA